METIVKVFPVSNVYCSIEVHLKDNEIIDRVAMAKHISILDEFQYVAPKWPKGMTCPVCGKGMVSYKRFQSQKPGPNQGKWYANYSCSVKDCSFVAWCNADDTSKTPNDEPFRSQFLGKANGSAKQEAKPAQTQVQQGQPPVTTAAPANGRGSAVQQQVPVDTSFMDEDLPF
jgi:hypothetical protein